MKDHVYKLIELTGTSTTSIEDAVNKAIKRANKTVKNLCWFQVVETRGNIDKGKVQHWQVTIKVGFTVAGLGLGSDAHFLFLDAATRHGACQSQATGEHQRCFRFQRPRSAILDALMGMAADDDAGPAVTDLVADASGSEAILCHGIIEQDDVDLP